MGRKRTTGDLPVERPLRLFVNDSELVTLMATPQDLEELAYGWLWSNKLIARVDDVVKLMVDADRALIWADIKGSVPAGGVRTISSGCGGGESITKWSEELPVVTGKLRVSGERLGRLFADFLQRAALYQETGGVHGAALAGVDSVVYVAEDIGRHNAVDKVIGWSLLNATDLSDRLILTTGRVSSEMLGKVARAGLAIVGSRTAPTDLAVKLAQAAAVTVVGYIRAAGYIVYSHEERITKEA